MKHKLHLNFAIVCLIILFHACSSALEDRIKESTDSVIATKIAANNSESIHISNLFKQNTTLPFTADTVLFDHIKNFDSLGSEEVKTLSLFSKNNKKESDYELNEFYKIDSIKAAGNYLKWWETLDIGMTKFANAYAIKKAEYDENTTLLFWSLSTSNYEACPYASQTSIYVTVLYQNETTSCFLLGETLSAGDPPVSIERIINGIFEKDGKIIQHLHQVDDEDMDQPFIEITNEYYESEIKNGYIKSIKEEKGKPVKTKRPKENS